MTSDIPLTRPPLAADLSPEGEKYITTLLNMSARHSTNLRRPSFPTRIA